MLVCLHVCACASVGHRTSLRPLRSLWSAAGCSLLFVSLNCLNLCVCSSPGYVLTVGVSGYQTRVRVSFIVLCVWFSYTPIPGTLWVSLCWMCVSVCPFVYILAALKSLRVTTSALWVILCFMCMSGNQRVSVFFLKSMSVFVYYACLCCVPVTAVAVCERVLTGPGVSVSFTCRCVGKELGPPSGAGGFWEPLGLGFGCFYSSRSLPGL